MNIHQINTQYSFLFEAACENNFTPKKFHENKMSYTLIPNEAEAFMINPPTAGFLTDAPPGDLIEVKKTHRGAIFRVVVGYHVMSKIENNYALGCLYLSTLINSMLYEANRFKMHSLDGFKKITFQRPYKKDAFFNEMENSAGFELRLHIEF